MRRVVRAAVPLALLVLACRPAPTRPDLSGTSRVDPARSYRLADRGRTFTAREHQEMGRQRHDNLWVFARRR